MGFEDDIFKITLLTPDLAEGKTGATPYFPLEKIGSCTGFSGGNRMGFNNRELSLLYAKR